MKSKHRKIFVSGAAVATAGALGVGILLQTVLSVQASSDMMPGIETIISENTEEEPFRILELVGNSEDAEIGYYISGQEPSLKLYEYQYTDSDGVTQKVHFSSVEEALSQLPEKARTEFMMNVKVNDDGNIDENADTGIKKISDVSGGDSTTSPLSFSQYQEKYFLNSDDDASEWNEVELTDFDGQTRIDTVQLNGSYQENTSGTGDYTKGEQQYYPIRNGADADEAQPEKYRENIQSFYPSEGSDSRGAYFLKFVEVPNSKVNSALDQKDGKQSVILPEYDSANGRYGYYENVYADLSEEIVKNIQVGTYQFPGENPDESVIRDKTPVQDNEKDAVQNTITDSNEFSSGETGSNSADSEVVSGSDQSDFGEENGSASGSVDFENGFQADDSNEGDAGESDAQSFDSDITLEQQSYEEPVDSSDAGAFSDDFSDQAVDSGDTSADADVTGQMQDNEDPFAGDETDLNSVEESGATTDNQVDPTAERRPIGGFAAQTTAGTQENPYIYLGKNIDQYPYYQYDLVGDLQYVVNKVTEVENAIQTNPDRGYQAGDIICDNEQYWYYGMDENNTLRKYALSIVTGRQVVSYNEIQKIPSDFDYNYYYRVEKVYFCCDEVENSDKDPAACAYLGWYSPSYPANEDAYIPVTDGDGKVATHYISEASYSLTPGIGNYDFVPVGDTAYQVQVDSFYYQGGYVNNDWFKKYVFHLTPKDSDDAEDGEFENFKIEVDTKSASDATTPVYAQAESDDSEDIQSSDTENAVSDGAGDTLTDSLKGYDLLYINGDLNQNVADAAAESGVPCIINAAKVSDGSAIATAFASLIRNTDEDADGHYVNTNVYFFKDTFVSGTADNWNLVNQNFHTNFNQDAESEEDKTYDAGDRMHGFEEIVKYINSENQYRSLGNNGSESGFSDGTSGDGSADAQSIAPLTREISQARAIEYIINYQYKRALSIKKNIEALEIMPDANCSALNENMIKNWLGAERGPEIDSITANCAHEATNAASNAIDGDRTTIWHSKWGNDTDYKSGCVNAHNEHYLTVTLKKETEVSGFYYLGRQDGAATGTLSSYTAQLYDTNGKLLGTETGTTGITLDNFKTIGEVQLKFSQKYQNVKSVKVIFSNTLGNTDGTPSKIFASCAEITFYDDSDNSITPTVTHMSASEFVGHIDDIGSKYDMIYIGDKKSGDDHSFVTGSGDLRYAHVGSAVGVTSSNQNNLLKLIGQLDKDYLDGDRTRFAPYSTYSEHGAGYFRGSGNDMTRQQYNALMDFVKSGYPVVVADGLVSNGKVNAKEVDSSSYYSEFISDALKYENVSTESELSQGKKNFLFFFNLAKPEIDFAEDGGKPVEPPRLNDGTQSSDTGYINGELKYTFTVRNDSDAAPATTTYDCDLYLDLNFDGNLAESENQSKYIVITDEQGNVLSRNAESHYELQVGKQYTVTRKIPADYYKIIAWKLELTSNRNTYIHTSESGYAKQKKPDNLAKQKIKVVQLLPPRDTWNLAESAPFKNLMNQVEDFEIELTTVKVNDINNGKYGNYNSMEDLLSDKQMLIIGFADVYQDINTNDVKAILKFIESGRSVIFAHDTTSYVNYDYNKMYKRIPRNNYDDLNDAYTVPYDEYLHKTAKNVTWGLGLNTILRSVTGMDRYGITSEAKIGNTIVSKLLKEGNELQDGSQVSFADLMKAAGDVALKNSDRTQSYAQTQGYTNAVLSNSVGDNSWNATKVNDGAITQYPYRMADNISISTTHGQYYQLALEQDKDINGNSDGCNDVVVWYCLPRGAYGESKNDVRNNYYLYSKGNVIYTGAGHSTISKEEEIKLFINAIVAAANVTAVQPQVNFVSSLNPAAEVESSRYYMTDQSSWATTGSEGNTLEKDMQFYIDVRDYNMVSADLSEEDQKEQKLLVSFYIEDNNGSVEDGSPAGNTPLRNVDSDIASLTAYGNGDAVTLSGEGFEITNNAYALTLHDIEKYLHTANGEYKENCKLYVKVTSTVSLYGQLKTNTSWSSIDLKKRQLFEMD